ncbi:MAG: hypothetical protein HY343_10280 [Lentisphaerae bacterium]|nr:hypothetical protein [Lentisphaerota bacterium]
MRFTVQGNDFLTFGKRKEPMGMFNTIIADIACPKTGHVSKDTEIQIKWQAHEARILDVYRKGDFLPDLLSKYDNTWVRTDYICNACSPKTTARDGTPYIRSDDQCWHIAFIEIRSGKVCRLLSESEFQGLGIDEFFDDVWPPV